MTPLQLVFVGTGISVLVTLITIWITHIKNAPSREETKIMIDENLSALRGDITDVLKQSKDNAFAVAHLEVKITEFIGIMNLHDYRMKILEEKKQ